MAFRLSLPLLLSLFTTGAAQANEQYNFYHLSCLASVGSFEIERVHYWDIGPKIWREFGPNAKTWPAHIALLKELEKKEGLYVFDEWYGYYEALPIDFGCGTYHAHIAFDKVLREPDKDGIRRPVRMNARLTLLSEESFVSQALPKNELVIARDLPLTELDRIRLYGSIPDDRGARHDYLVVCKGTLCSDDELANQVSPIDEATIGQLTRP